MKQFIDENISQQETFYQIAKSVAKVLGNLVGRLHTENIFHGDLTTSNILLRDVSNETKCVNRGTKNILPYIIIIDLLYFLVFLIKMFFSLQSK